MQPSEWPEYLEALEDYLEIVTVAIIRGQSALAPARLANRPVGPVPLEFAARAIGLSVEIDRVAALARSRRAEVLVAKWALNDRRHVEARRVGRRVDSAL